MVMLMTGFLFLLHVYHVCLHAYGTIESTTFHEIPVQLRYSLGRLDPYR